MATNQGAISTIPVEVFATYIVEKLRRQNPHLEAAVDESSFVLAGSVVHIPQAGNSPEVVKNRKSFPATAVQRGDSFVTYPLDVFSTTPTHITWHEENEISYDKTDSVMGDHVATLVEAVGDHMTHAWASGLGDVKTGGNFILTTGDATAVADLTGTRKALTYRELQAAQAMMNKAGVPKEERYAMLESYMYQQFLDSLSANQMAAFQGSADLAKGVVGEFAGFKILERSTVLAYTTAGKLKAVGEALTGTDCLASLCWQKQSVAKAIGDTKSFHETNSPTYYGDIFSALVKSGGRCRRGDSAGVVVIEQVQTEG